jgi:biopolymer transport protein ExbB
MEWLKRSIDFGIIGFLILLSIIAMAIAVERLLIYRRIRVEHFKDKRTLELHLSNKLHIIASIGSNAPYIGLLGTVLGIMVIFIIWALRA